MRPVVLRLLLLAVIVILVSQILRTMSSRPQHAKPPMTVREFQVGERAVSVAVPSGWTLLVEENAPVLAAEERNPPKLFGFASGLYLPREKKVPTDAEEYRDYLEE